MTIEDTTTLEELLAERPDGPCPDAPAWHVESRGCYYGWISGGTTWILCDCEDPAHPWPPRELGDGPRDCECFGCHDHEPRWERGKLKNCEYKDHHCDMCHEHGHCTIAACGFWRP